MDDKTREWFRAQGRIGGKKRSGDLTAEERRSLATRAAEARWYKGYRVTITKVVKEGPAQIRAWACAWDRTTSPRAPVPSPLQFPGVGATESTAKARAKQNARKWITKQQPRTQKKGGK